MNISAPPNKSEWSQNPLVKSQLLAASVADSWVFQYCIPPGYCQWWRTSDTGEYLRFKYCLFLFISLIGQENERRKKISCTQKPNNRKVLSLKSEVKKVLVNKYRRKKYLVGPGEDRRRKCLSVNMIISKKKVPSRVRKKYLVVRACPASFPRIAE